RLRSSLGALLSDENGTEVERAGQGASRTGILAEAGGWHEAPLELARLTDCEWKPALRRRLRHRGHRQSSRKKRRTIASPAICDSRRTMEKYRNACCDPVAMRRVVRSQNCRRACRGSLYR